MHADQSQNRGVGEIGGGGGVPVSAGTGGSLPGGGSTQGPWPV